MRYPRTGKKTHGDWWLFTGTKDSEGTKIYEGDLVSIPKSRKHYLDGVYIVGWYNPHGCWAYYRPRSEWENAPYFIRKHPGKYMPQMSSSGKAYILRQGGTRVVGTLLRNEELLNEQD